jgi:hypothetical protein
MAGEGSPGPNSAYQAAGLWNPVLYIAVRMNIGLKVERGAGSPIFIG